MNKAQLNQKLQASETAHILAIAENRTLQDRVLLLIQERNDLRDRLTVLAAADDTD